MKMAMSAVVLACVCSGTMYADFSYQQTGQITGGMMAGMMKFAGMFSKQAREPMVTHVYVKGHRIAHVNQHTAQIMDVDAGTITDINFDRKTYSVITFDQMRQQFEQMSKDMQGKTDPNANLHMNVSVKNTGQTKDVSGLTAKELMLTMSVQGTDPQSGQTGSMDIRSDMWMAPVDGYDQVREVYRLMGEKLGFVMGGNLLPLQRPDLVKDMGELYKEMEKIDGMPVETVVTLGGSGTAPASQGSGANASSNSSSDESAKNQSATQAAVGEAMSRLGGLGGFGGFGHRKKKAASSEDQQQQQQAPPPQQSQSAAGENGQQSGTLLEMTTHASDFSTAAVDESHFAVPEGFKQVQPEEKRRGQ